MIAAYTGPGQPELATETGLLPQLYVNLSHAPEALHLRGQVRFHGITGGSDDDP